MSLKPLPVKPDYIRFCTFRRCPCGATRGFEQLSDCPACGNPPQLLDAINPGSIYCYILDGLLYLHEYASGTECALNEPEVIMLLKTMDGTFLSSSYLDTIMRRCRPDTCKLMETVAGKRVQVEGRDPGALEPATALGSYIYTQWGRNLRIIRNPSGAAVTIQKGDIEDVAWFILTFFPWTEPEPAGAETIYPPCALHAWPTAPAPWSSNDRGEKWVWDDFFLLLQKSPRTIEEVTDRERGFPALPQSIKYAWALSIFYRRNRTPREQSRLPVMVVTLEQADSSRFFGEPDRIPLWKRIFHSRTRWGPVYLGLFIGSTHLNLGAYHGELRRETVRQRLFQVARERLGLTDSPSLSGAMTNV